MAIPVLPNDTCDIYRAANSPPATPDVKGVKCYLKPKGQSSLTTPYYTHLMLVAVETDIRDDYDHGNFTAGAGSSNWVWVPDMNGNKFNVILVRRVGKGTPLDHKQVLLKRVATTYPSEDL